jgi:hypothetical protein
MTLRYNSAFGGKKASLLAGDEFIIQRVRGNARVILILLLFYLY